MVAFSSKLLLNHASNSDSGKKNGFAMKFRYELIGHNFLWV